MAKHEMLEVVNNQVVDDDNAFADGFREDISATMILTINWRARCPVRPFMPL
jgi:hypothetical protein